MKLKIALLAGDGIGPEVTDQAVKVCNSIAKKFNHEILWIPALTGAVAIEQTGDPYPEETHQVCINSDAVLFGAIGHPRFDNDPSASVRPSIIPETAFFADSMTIPFAVPVIFCAALSKSLFLNASMRFAPPAAARPTTPVAKPLYAALVLSVTLGGK